MLDSAAAIDAPDPRRAASIGDLGEAAVVEATGLTGRLFALAVAGQATGARVVALLALAKDLTSAVEAARAEIDACAIGAEIDGRIAALCAACRDCADVAADLETARAVGQSTLEAWRGDETVFAAEFDRRIGLASLERRIATLSRIASALQLSSDLSARQLRSERQVRKELDQVLDLVAAQVLSDANAATPPAKAPAQVRATAARKRPRRSGKASSGGLAASPA
jgi:hypothetical protein